VVIGQEVKVLKTIDDIGKESMDSIADDGFFTYGYLKALETSKSLNFVPVYLAVYDEDKIIAAMPCYIDSEHQLFSLESKFPLTRRIVNMINHLGFDPNRLLVCSSPSSYHSKILLRKDSEGEAILNQVCRRIDDVCRRERILFSSFPYVSEFESLLIENLEDFGYLRLPSVNTLYLDVKWSDFEDYVESLESHKIRANVKREIRKCQESGVTIAEESEFGDLAPILADLHSNLFSKYNKGVASPRDASFFRKLSEFAKDKTRVLIAKRHSKIVGFSLSLQQKGILDVFVLGFDYDAQMNTDLTYFNLVYYEPIKMAIKEGIRRIHFSIKSEKLKLKRGCKFEKTYSFVKCHSRLFRPPYNLYIKKKYAR
jgi:predicted N-acyltransferase